MKKRGGQSEVFFYCKHLCQGFQFGLQTTDSQDLQNILSTGKEDIWRPDKKSFQCLQHPKLWILWITYKMSHISDSVQQQIDSGVT